jgi:hypothetical protein
MPYWADFTIATRGYSFRKGQASRWRFSSPAGLIDGRLIVLWASGVHLFRRLVMAWLAHAIRFRSEVVALARFVPVGL